MPRPCSLASWFPSSFQVFELPVRLDEFHGYVERRHAHLVRLFDLSERAICQNAKIVCRAIDKPLRHPQVNRFLVLLEDNPRDLRRTVSARLPTWISRGSLRISVRLE